MKNDFRLLANSGIRSIDAYQPAKRMEDVERELGIISSVKLASNENHLGPRVKAVAAAQSALNQLHHYPDGHQQQLKQAISQLIGAKPEQLTIGNGSDNILELIVKSYLHNDGAAVISQYAFLTIPLLIKSYGALAQVVPAQAWGHDITGMINAVIDKTRMMFVVNPNNPTGTYMNAADFDLLLRSVPSHVLIVVDEAYVEYAAAADYPDTLSYINRYPNLIVVRTFSKAYGLAALRLGYAVSSVEMPIFSIAHACL